MYQHLKGVVTGAYSTGMLLPDLKVSITWTFRRYKVTPKECYVIALRGYDIQRR